MSIYKHAACTICSELYASKCHFLFSSQGSTALSLIANKHLKVLLTTKNESTGSENQPSTYS